MTAQGVTRRSFLKLALAAGSVGAVSGMGLMTASGVYRVPREPTPSWEVEPGIVDYNLVPEGKLTGPTPNVLKVAQWYDYWPGSFLTDFQRYMKQTYHLDVTVQWDVFTSNEELFEWITLGKRRYDVFVPSNYVTDLMKNGQIVYNLNLDWLPNFKANADPQMISFPKDDPFDRLGPNGPFVSVPYMWGTTGIGFRSDRIPKDEIESLGFDLFWMSSYQPKTPGYPAVDLRKKMRMLDDERDVMGWGFKKAGWEEQLKKGLAPTGIPSNPDPPYKGQYQWTTNETDPAKVEEAGRWLMAARPNIFDFNSTEDAASLAGGSAVVNQAWSGDIMYAKRPDQNRVPLPADYVIPKQGSTWWIDTVAIHSKCRNLWLAHQFLDFIHRVDKPWEENQLLTKWNLYSTPNKACYQKLWDWEHPNPGFATGWRMTEDPILYPNIYAPEDFKRCDVSGDVGIKALLDLYNPLWFELTE